MAAGEIKIRMDDSPHRVNNANCVWSHLTLSNNVHMSGGWLMRNAEVADLNIDLPVPIPTNINATPNGKIRICWLTSSSDTSNAVKFFCGISDVVENSDSVDPSAFDMAISTNVTDTSGGAGILNTVDVTVSGPTLSAGRHLIGLIRRDSTDAGDTLAADVYVTRVLFVADI